MTDQKLTQLTEDTSPALTDIVYGVKNPGGTPLSRWLKWSTIKTLLLGTYEAGAFASADGWNIVTGWSYASATTITVSSGAASIYSVGDKLRFQNNDSGTYLYAYVVGVADTLLTVVGDAVPNATLTDCYYSKASSPIGFNHSFAYTPSTNITLGSGTLTGVFSVTSGVCMASVYFKKAADTTLPSSGGYFTVPILSRATPTTYWTCSVLVGDAGTAEHLMVGMLANNNLNVNFASDNTAGGLSPYDPMTWATNDYLSFSISYPIL